MIRVVPAVLALVLGTSMFQKGIEISAEDSEWLGQADQRAYDALFPLDVPGGRAAYRTDPDNRLDEFERYFVIAIAKPPSQRLEATVVVPVGNPIRRQLLDLRHKDVRASFESILVQVSVRRFTVDSAGCPAIASQMKSLSMMNLRVEDNRMIYVDHTIHEFMLWSPPIVINAQVREEKHELVQWATKTLDALLACGEKKFIVP